MIGEVKLGGSGGGVSIPTIPYTTSNFADDRIFELIPHPYATIVRTSADMTVSTANLAVQKAMQVGFAAGVKFRPIVKPDGNGEIDLQVRISSLTRIATLANIFTQFGLLDASYNGGTQDAYIVGVHGVEPAAAPNNFVQLSATFYDKINRDTPTNYGPTTLTGNPTGFATLDLRWALALGDINSAANGNLWNCLSFSVDGAAFQTLAITGSQAMHYHHLQWLNGINFLIAMGSRNGINGMSATFTRLTITKGILSVFF